MKLIVTHTSPDWDAIGSVWVIKKFLPGWQEAEVVFVPAGQRLVSYKSKWKPVSEPAEKSWEGEPLESIDGHEVLQVDTGMGPLDHHQVFDTTVSGAGLSWKYVQDKLGKGDAFTPEHKEAVTRVINFIVATDHFKEVFWENPAADYHEFSLLGLMEGIKLMRPNADLHYLQFGIECLDAMLHNFENRIWAEKEIAEKGQIFETKWGKAIGFETVNDSVLKLAQKMGYVLVLRKDPRKGYVRIKVRPAEEGEKGIDLTLVHEKLKKIDPEATWYLHVSKKMLLNGTPKNPAMIPTKLPLEKIIDVIKGI